ncbi:DUF4845 domain-containing protein [Inmirania thermothiophila]|uniref:Uncharacterized protein DUF4845 n=1 Tax=Inmirania thermothiophila TaxID=1750597 RepID=A0A3N1XZY3_9GAMM|nr:DUF4845 domain-containing protein [Inmirania thermothiophila]ROR32130.1 uncharacterized protein DUF4845 [Inmirania thermothiophila]
MARGQGKGGGPARARGLTLLGALAALLIGGFFLLLALRLIPVYLEHFEVKASMRSLIQDPAARGAGPGEIRELLMRRLDINDVDRVGKDAVKVLRERGGHRVVVAYQVQVPILGNVDALVRFHDEVFIGAP